jgi:hypothetical protein
MSGGVEIVRAALVANAALIALVPAARIIGDDALPQDITYPAITLARISGIDRNILNPGTYRHVTERVQVTIFAATRPSRKQVLAAVRKAAADKLNISVSGLINITIHTDSTGPDFIGEGEVRITTQDFKVTYSEVR